MLRQLYSRCQGSSFCNIHQSGLKLHFPLMFGKSKGVPFQTETLPFLVWKTRFSQMLVRLVPLAALEFYEVLTAPFLASPALLPGPAVPSERVCFPDAFCEAGLGSSEGFQGFLQQRGVICAVCKSPPCCAHHLGCLLQKRMVLLDFSLRNIFLLRWGEGGKGKGEGEGERGRGRGGRGRGRTVPGIVMSSQTCA